MNQPATSTTMTIVPKVLTIDPVTRIEGHLRIVVEVDKVNGRDVVVNAYSTGTMFRGFEKILQGREPWDAVPITQRICGVCPVAHGMAATLALESAAGIRAPDNGRILRNLVLGANFLQSHILHFYHLALLDFIDGPQVAPWDPRWSSDKRIDPATASNLFNHYVAALDMRRAAHEMGAIFGGRLPHPPSFVPGGITMNPNAAHVQRFAGYLGSLATFINTVYIPDVATIGQYYPEYFQLGAGPGNLLTFGAFDLNADGSSKLFPRGRAAAAGPVSPVEIARITESVKFSWYNDSTDNLPVTDGDTVPAYPKPNAYSWLKAPRYSGQPFEAGPLARMWIAGGYRRGVSVMDRHAARAQEALVLSQAMQGWLGQIAVGRPVFQESPKVVSASAMGLTEAARGALGHWVDISESKISNYQVITPTCWNASPRDGQGVLGPIEQALLGTPVTDQTQPIEVMRVVHSFDPCLACAVHVMRPSDSARAVVLHA